MLATMLCRAPRSAARPQLRPEVASSASHRPTAFSALRRRPVHLRRAQQARQAWTRPHSRKARSHRELATRSSADVQTADESEAEDSAAANAKVKIANLEAGHFAEVELPASAYGTGPLSLATFLATREGRFAVLNLRNVRKIEQLAPNRFRCYVGRLELLGFEVEPVCEFSVESGRSSCALEMSSVQLEGSRILQKARFAASMANRLSWGEPQQAGASADEQQQQQQQQLALDTTLRVDLEMYTLPFRLMPKGSVERPGSALLRRVLRRMQPMFLSSLLHDFARWQDDQRSAALDGAEREADDPSDAEALRSTKALEEA